MNLRLMFKPHLVLDENGKYPSYCSRAQVTAARAHDVVSSCDCFQAGEEEMGDFTKEVLTMWKVSVVAGERCTAPKAGRKGIETIPFLFARLVFNSLLSKYEATAGA